MKRVGLIGLVIAALLVISASPVMASDVQMKNSTTNVEVWFKNVDEKDKTTEPGTLLAKYYMTSTIKIEIYNLDPDDSYTWYIVERYSGDVEKIGSFTDAAAKFIEFPASDLYPGKFYFKLVNRTGEVFNSSDPNVSSYPNGTYIWVYKTGIPSIEVHVKTPTVAEGDKAKVKIVAEDLRSGDKVLWWVEGPFDAQGCYADPNCKVPTGVAINQTARDMKLLGQGPGKVDKSVYINTSELIVYADGTYGVYRVKAIVYNSAQGGVVTSAGGNFELVELTLNVVYPDTIYKGTEFFIYGSTNMAEQGSEYDYGTLNVVNMTIYYPNGSVFRTSYGNTTVMFVRSDSSFRMPGTAVIPLSAPTGSYKFYFDAVSDKSANYTIDEDKTVYINVAEPKIEFAMDKLTFSRGEKLYIKGTATVKQGTEVVISASGEDLGSFLEYSDGTPIGSTLTVSVGADQKWSTDELRIKSTAERKTYTIKAEIDLGSNNKITATTTIRVAKAVLNATIDKNKVTRGGSFTLSGTTGLDYVLVYTDRDGILKDVTKIPEDNEPFDKQPNDRVVTVSNDRFSVKLEVEDDAKVGTYTLYVIAPANVSHPDPTEDEMAQLAFEVVEFGLAQYPSSIKIAKGDSYDLYIKVAGDPDDLCVRAEIKGSGVRVYEENFRLSKFNESEETETGWVFNTIYPYYNDSDNSLDSSFKYDENVLLPAGLYTVTVHLYKDKNCYSEVESVNIPMEVIIPDMNVAVSDVVKKGDDLKVRIETNRGGSYDYLYVVLDLGAKQKVYSRIPIDENGVAEVSIPTGDIEPGEYTLYVRDAMGTLEGYGGDFDIKNMYDMEPTDSVAKAYGADDDLLFKKVIKVVEELPTTTTTVATTTTTAITTTTAVTTTTVEETTTTAAVTTTTEKPSGGIPGFEAVFAIAGLLAVAYLLRRR